MDSTLIISLGANCSVKFSIQHFVKNQMAYPFDWLITNNIEYIANFIQNKNPEVFMDFTKYVIRFIACTNAGATSIEKEIMANLDQERLKKLIIDANTNPTKSFEEFNLFLLFKNLVTDSMQKINYSGNIDQMSENLYKKAVCVLENNRTALFHDHHINVSWKEVSEKYKRRFERFEDLYKTTKPILFIRYSQVDENVNILYTALKNNFKNFCLLSISLNNNVEGLQNFNKISDNFYKYAGKLSVDIHPFHINIVEKFMNDIYRK